MVLDVETANDLNDAMVYDIGFAVVDTWQNRIVKEYSYVIEDVFYRMADVMTTAYYAAKIPQYIEDVQNGKRKVVSFKWAKYIIARIMDTYKIKEVYAYNASFDRNALNQTLRYLTKSEERHFFSDKIRVKCIWNMACQTICQTLEYKEFCEENGYFANRERNYKTSAEMVYRFLHSNTIFEEVHMGIEDVRIETEILLKISANFTGYSCRINKGCWQKVKRVGI